jgi:hypothetical protein
MNLSMDWMLIPQIILVVLVIAAMIVGGLRARDPFLPAQFAPDAHNDKSIMVTGWSEVELRQVILDFEEAYDWSDYPVHPIEVHTGESGAYRLTFPQDIHPEMLPALVNYLAYPHEMNPLGRTIQVVATTTLAEGFEKIDAAHWGKEAFLYIPEGDRDHDAVYMQTEDGMTFECRLPKCIWNPAGSARLPVGIEDLLGGTG